MKSSPPIIPGFMGRRPAALLPIWLPARTMSAPKIRENRKTAAVCVPAEREAPNPAAQPSKERAADRDRASLAEILWELSLSALAGEEESKSLSTPKRNKMPKLKRVVKPGGIKSFTKEPASMERPVIRLPVTEIIPTEERGIFILEVP